MNGISGEVSIAANQILVRRNKVYKIFHLNNNNNPPSTAVCSSTFRLAQATAQAPDRISSLKPAARTISPL